MSRMTGLGVLVAALMALLLSACSDDDAPYLAFDGGGFIFNYRIAEAFYGFNVRPMRRLAPGTVLEAEFENPAGGEPYLVRETVVGDRLRYSFRTPPVQGVKANRNYQVRVSVLAGDTGAQLGVYEKTIHSDLDQSVLPKKPLTIGPGYALNPDNAEAAQPPAPAAGSQ